MPQSSESKGGESNRDVDGSGERRKICGEEGQASGKGRQADRKRKRGQDGGKGKRGQTRKGRQAANLRVAVSSLNTYPQPNVGNFGACFTSSTVCIGGAENLTRPQRRSLYDTKGDAEDSDGDGRNGLDTCGEAVKSRVSRSTGACKGRRSEVSIQIKETSVTIARQKFARLESSSIMNDLKSEI
ncbi:hypothetical protein CERSUDRAFT_70064 [Gelatoporia subvermispora B]|uniref:Uncharacterized protein n=1 Tax=Ceriporiopsis subvermispora (strain B) TaxID=914234 RepID=M2RAT3_CERS8|nr:hypothetical protein CERSUDRAFT_70064 [Gelatoporia subvermispora B]